MEVLVVAADSLKALSLVATLDVGGHRVVGLAHSAAAALAYARTRHPSLAIVQLGGQYCVGLISELRDDLCVPSLLVGSDAECTDAHRAGAIGLLREPCGSRLILRAVRVAAGLREGSRPRGRLPRQIEVFGSSAPPRVRLERRTEMGGQRRSST